MIIKDSLKRQNGYGIWILMSSDHKVDLFGISGLLHQVVTAIADRIQGDIFKSVSTAVCSGTYGESSVAGSAGIMTVEVINVIATEHIFQLQALLDAESNSLPHAYAQTTKTYCKHQDSRIKNSKVHTRQRLLQTLIFKIFRIDIKNFKIKMSREIISKLSRSCKKTKSKDNDKGSRSKITKHGGTSLQHDKDQRFKNSMTNQSQQVQGSKIQDHTLGIRRPRIRGDC
ncbi:hypothetical protein Tco_1044505 [Tanacetum coccineum]|uniref:Uncharacterized protein n=1 Tax=Tanacetum coccineum TaxID=301880 RepID=A0ABQ5GQ38_9ASTR